VASIWSELKRRNVVKVAIAYAVVGWLLVEIVTTILPTFDAPRWVTQTITFVIILGFPLALVFAWAFELTPEGLKLERKVERSESVTEVTGRKLDFVIIAVLVVAVAYFAVDEFVLEPAIEQQTEASAQLDAAGDDTGADNSIAVLAFSDLSPEGDQEYFADGVSEEILNDLAQIPGLHVTSRSSSFNFKGKDVHIPTVAQQLGVANVLEGSVRKAGNRVRITAQLIDAGNDSHLWSNTYDRDLEDIFAVQDEISTAIVAALQEHLGLDAGATHRPVSTANTEAHEAYLRGRHLIVQSTRPATEAAIGEFQTAISLDPDYALAHAELAIGLSFQEGITGSRIREATKHIERALELDPDLAEAHAAAALIAWRRSRVDEALAHFRRAIELNPNYVFVHTAMGNLLNYDLGRYAEAFEARATAMRLDPLAIGTIVFYLQALIERRHFEEADRVLETIASIYPHIYAYRRGSRLSMGGEMANAVLGSLEAIRISPGYTRPRYGLGYHFAALGMVDEMLAQEEFTEPLALINAGYPRLAVEGAEALVTATPDSPQRRLFLGLALAAAGDFERARPILEELWRQSGGFIAKRSDLFRTSTAVALIAIRRAAGEEDRVGELIAAILDNVRRYREAGIVGDGRSFGADYEEGFAWYLSGEREKGLALLDSATEDGVHFPENLAYLQVFYDDPGFAPILERQRVRQARERARVLAVVCTNNPYAAVWRPAPGTCDEFDAAAFDSNRAYMRHAGPENVSDPIKLDATSRPWPTEEAGFRPRC
jgi:TolB-like protein/Flp pilus assembly protein TadD